MELYRFEVISQEDKDFVALMVLGLEKIKEHYKPESETLEYDKETKDLDFFGIINNAATIWSEKFLLELKDLVVGNHNILLMSEREFQFIKYTTEVYLDYVGENIGKYGKINTIEKFKYIENKQRSKNILKIVK